MLTRCVLAFTMIAGAALAGPASSHDGLVKGQTTVAEVEQGLGAPADTIMRDDGALTLLYTYARCSQLMPATFPASETSARTVSLRFGADFRYHSKTISNVTPTLASNDASFRTMTAK